MRQIHLLSIMALSTITVPVSAQYSFTGFSLPDELAKSSLSGVTYDGSRVVGATPETDGFSRPLYLESGTTHFLPLGDFGNGFARGVNPDGSIIVGQVTPGHALSPDRAAVWTSGALSLLQEEPSFVESRANAISSSGRVIVGVSDSSTHLPQAARWVDGQVFPMGDLNGGSHQSAALGVSADGSIIIGYGASFAGNTTAFRWQDNQLEALPSPAGDYIVSSIARDVSVDGSVIVGEVVHRPPDTAGTLNATVWIDGLPRDLRDQLPGGAFDDAIRVSDDGSVIFGQGSIGTNPAVVVWDAEHGGRSLSQMLTDAGVDLRGWQLYTVQDVSGDGKTILGYGFDPHGDYNPFIATIPEPGTLTFAAVGFVRALKNLWHSRPRL